MMLRTLRNHSLLKVQFSCDMGRLGRRLMIALFWVQKWRCNAKTRKQLEQMPSYLLRDIGLTERQRKQEIDKTFWQ